MKLLSKVLILLAVPLSGEVLLVSSLLGQNAEIERESQRMVQAKAMNQSLFFVQSSYLNGIALMYKVSMSGSYQDLIEFNRLIDRLPRLNKMVRRQAQVCGIEHSKPIERLEVVSREVQSKLQCIQQAALNSSDIAADLSELSKEFDRSRPLLRMCLDALSELMDWQWRLQKDSERRQVQLHNAVTSTLIWGGMLNLVLVVLLAVWLNRVTISRLKCIMANVKRIGLELPLVHTAMGNDEISELDRILHQVSRSLLDAREKEREAEATREAFYSMVTRELRVPLNAVIAGILRVAAGTLGLVSEKANKTLRLAAENSQRALQLINDFLDLRTLDEKSFELKLGEVDACELIDSCIQTVLPQALEKKITLSNNASSYVITADKVNLGRVLTNLLTNAIKFSPHNSEITVRLSTEAGVARFEIYDQGSGIPADRKDDVFARFKQLPGDHVQQGTGLGLAICKLLVEQHGGSIGVKDNTPQGSVFYFTLPLESISK
ncbi:MAG: HAMP domain-containing histidine kinase [Candidatus Obscuribacterales bacterium]|nr:HAMP domain-containing histidine kinase [Candidatus Obscuribacterales bacterium]